MEPIVKKTKFWRYTPTESDQLREKLKHANDSLEHYKSVNASQVNTIHLLQEKHLSLMLRNAEFTKLKIIEQIGESKREAQTFLILML